MNEDDLMFGWGFGAAAAVLLLTAIFQVSFRVQDKARADTRGAIVDAQKRIAVAESNFASYVRPEILRNLVMATNPKAETIGFNKSVSIGDLPARE